LSIGWGTHSSRISRNRRAGIRIEKTDTVGDDARRDKGEYDAPKHLKDCAGRKNRNQKPRFVVVRISSHEVKNHKKEERRETGSVQQRREMKLALAAHYTRVQPNLAGKNGRMEDGVCLPVFGGCMAARAQFNP
jgi:hypothetical protein